MRTFLGCWDDLSVAKVRICGIPSSRFSIPDSHANLGPKLIRIASNFISDTGIPAGGLVDQASGIRLCKGVSVVDMGDFPYPNSLACAMELQELLFGSPSELSVALLGDDSCNFPILVGREGVLIHFDAHDDRSCAGNGITHANFVRLLLEHSPNLWVVQFGPRGCLHPDRIIEGHSRVSRATSMNELNDILLDFALRTPVYIAVDLDILDPDIFPDVSCPEPNGLDWSQLSDCLRSVFRAMPVRLFTVSEFSPQADERASMIRALRIAQMIVDVLHLGAKRETDSKS